MEDSFPIVIKEKQNIYRDTELDDIADMIVIMADESEGKKLVFNNVKEAVELIIANPDYGAYFLILDKTLSLFCGIDMITYAYIIQEDKVTPWLQTVYVDPKYRMKGMFKKLLKENENYISKNDKMKNCLRLYADKDNTKAQQTYLRCGFTCSQDYMCEIDYYFNKTNDDSDEANEVALKMVELDLKTLELLDSSYLSLITGGEVVIKDHITGLEKVTRNNKLGKVVIGLDVSV
jgi:GNAT superfamily N-acetyltransferase